MCATHVQGGAGGGGWGKRVIGVTSGGTCRTTSRRAEHATPPVRGAGEGPVPHPGRSPASSGSRQGRPGRWRHTREIQPPPLPMGGWLRRTPKVHRGSDLPGEGRGGQIARGGQNGGKTYLHTPLGEMSPPNSGRTGPQATSGGDNSGQTGRPGNLPPTPMAACRGGDRANPASARGDTDLLSGLTVHGGGQ